MKKIGIIVNKNKYESYKCVESIIEYALKYKLDILVECSVAKELEIECHNVDENFIIDNADIIICLGGDGTFIRAARAAYQRELPILGINFGTLGFLTEIDKNEIGFALRALAYETYNIDERIMLDIKIKNKGKKMLESIAFNDVVISRGALSRILHVRTYVNNDFVESFPGDGIIISSPSGSTAYSLSAGGPIVEPESDLLIITPICPHMFSTRSYIINGNKLIHAQVDEKYDHDAMVTVDGQVGYNIKGGDIVEVCRAEKKIKVIRIKNTNYFSVLRRKIFDRGECLRKDEI